MTYICSRKGEVGVETEDSKTSHVLKSSFAGIIDKETDTFQENAYLLACRASRNSESTAEELRSG